MLRASIEIFWMPFWISWGFVLGPAVHKKLSASVQLLDDNRAQSLAKCIGTIG